MYHSVWCEGWFSNHFYEEKHVHQLQSCASKSISGIMSASKQGLFLFPHHKCALKCVGTFQVCCLKGSFQAPVDLKLWPLYSIHFLTVWWFLNSSKFTLASAHHDKVLCETWDILVSSGMTMPVKQMSRFPRGKRLHRSTSRPCNFHSHPFPLSVTCHLWDLLS